MEASEQDRVLFRDKTTDDFFLISALVPAILLVMGLMSWDFDFPGKGLAAIGALGILILFLWTKQRLTVTARGFRPSARRGVVYLRSTAFVPWTAVTSLWPIYALDMETEEPNLVGFGALAGELGEVRLVPAFGSMRKKRLVALKESIEKALGTRKEDVWCEIPQLGPKTVSRMKKALLTSSGRVIVTAMTLPVISFTLILTLMFYLGYGELPVSSLQDVYSFFAVVWTVLALLMGVMVFGLMWSSIRIQSHLEAISLYFQVRGFEAETGRMELPPVQMLYRYSWLDPRRPKMQAQQATQLVRSHQSCVVWIIVAAFAAILVPSFLFAALEHYHLPMMIGLSGMPVFAALFLCSLYLLARVMENVEDLKMVFHEEWITGKTLIPRGEPLRLWGLRRNPEAYLQKRIPSLMSKKQRNKRSDTVVGAAVIGVTFLILLAVLLAPSGARAEIGFMSLFLFLVVVATLMGYYKMIDWRDEAAIRSASAYEMVTGKPTVPVELNPLRKREA